MTDSPAELARQVAIELRSELGGGIVADVDREVSRGVNGQFFDPISLGALVVSVASLAWTIYQDRRDSSKLHSEVLSRQLRVEIGVPDGATIDQRDRIIDVTVGLVIRDE